MLRCDTDAGTAAGVVVETEAYRGRDDPASHGVRGPTPRTHHLFGAPGTIYVYRSYGLHWCVNAVTAPRAHGSAVLIRALRPLVGETLMWPRRPKARRATDLTSGPGKLCAALGITGAHDGADGTAGALTFHAGVAVADADVTVTPRVGITKAADWPLRFCIRGDPHVSRGKPSA